METLLKFNRVKKLLADLGCAQVDAADDAAKAVEVLRQCVRDSQELTLVNGEGSSEDKETMVRTVAEPQLPPASADTDAADADAGAESKGQKTFAADDCVLMVQQLPSNASLDDLLEFFGGLNGEQGVVLVQMRRSKADGKFLGSAWVEFRDSAAAEAFFKRAEETEAGLVMQGSQLVVQRKYVFTSCSYH